MPFRRIVVLALVPVALTACMTGERPTITEDTIAVEVEPAVEAVLDLLEQAPAAAPSYTATYDVLRRYGGATTTAVISADPGRWSLTVGDVRFLDLDGVRSTCDLATGTCTDGFEEARISDVLTTSGFATDAAAIRLRRAAQSALTPSTSDSRTIAGLDATCVSIDVPGGTVQWCAVPQGLLALQDTADLRIDLIEFTETVAADSFATTR